MDRLLQPFRWLTRVVASAAYKFYWDDCFSRASSLAYTTLFALVPISALMFAMFRGFELDQVQLEKLIQNVLPPIAQSIDPDMELNSEAQLLRDVNAQVVAYLTEFGEKVRELSTVSLAVVVFIGIALVNTIQSALNAVWRVSSSTGIISRIISFWGVITLGPLLIAVSFYWYSRFDAYTGLAVMMPAWLAQLLNFIVPMGSIWMAFTLLFYNLPAAKVAIRDAAIGALVAAILFEITKRGFAEYISHSTTYSSFYGVLVAVPVFLFWLYVVWVVVLFGAEISYQAGAIKILSGLRKYASDLGETGAVLGISILYVIGRNFVRGEPPPTEGEIALETGTDPVLVRTCLNILADADLITVADQQHHTRSLKRAPDRITVGTVVEAFYSKQYRLRGDAQSESDPLSGVSFLNVLRQTTMHVPAERPLREWTLAELLQEG